MSAVLMRMLEPGTALAQERKSFSNADIRKLTVPLLLEQLLVMLVGVADTFMVSYAGDAAVSGVSLVNMFNTVFIYLFTALASGGRGDRQPIHREPGCGARGRRRRAVAAAGRGGFAAAHGALPGP